jgi:hypothetical protein
VATPSPTPTAGPTSGSAAPAPATPAPGPVTTPAPGAADGDGTAPAPKPSLDYVKRFWRLSVRAAIEAAIDFLDAVADVLKTKESDTKESA